MDVLNPYLESTDTGRYQNVLPDIIQHAENCTVVSIEDKSAMQQRVEQLEEVVF